MRTICHTSRPSLIHLIRGLGVTYDDVLKTIRDEIQAEHTLISHRLTWFVGFQSVLFTAYAIAWGKDHQFVAFFQFAMPALGVLFSGLAAVGAQAAFEVQDDLLDEQGKLVSVMVAAAITDKPDEVPVLEAYRRTICCGRKSEFLTHRSVQRAIKAMPIAVFLTWVIGFLASFIG